MSNKDFNKVVFYDLETANLTPRNYIVTLAYIYYERGKEPIVGQIKCNPDYQISKQATAVNGIDNKMAKDWPLFPEVWPSIEPYFRDSVWIGYNSNSFDQAGMRLEFKRYGCKEPHHWNLDVMQIAKRMIPKGTTQNYKLITMCKHFGIEGDNFHTSDFDTWGTKEVYFKLKKMNKDSDGLYDELFEPIEIDGEYTQTPPPCVVDEDDFNY